MTLAFVLAPTAYAFGSGTSLTYEVKAKFEGFLPLFGGNEGVVDVGMTVGVKGHDPEDGALKATSEIQAFDLKFNEASLPVTVDNAAQFFPRTTVTLSPQGRILSNDAPERKLPVRLPGLDVKRFPEITYVPIEFPDQEIRVGETWTFERDFGGSPVVYECTLSAASEDTAEIMVNIRQEFTVLENAALEVVSAREDAVAEVRTVLTGQGKVRFDTARGIATASEMTNEALSDVRNLATGDTNRRKLKTVYRVELQAAAGERLQAPARPKGWSLGLDTVKTFVAWVQMAVQFGLSALPREIERWAPGIGRMFPWLSQGRGRVQR
jgi:hypothetical protein